MERRAIHCPIFFFVKLIWGISDKKIQEKLERLGYILALKENYIEAVKWIDQFIAEVSDPGMKAIGYVW